MSARLTVQPLSPTIGAVISPINLGQPLDDITIAKLKTALENHLVLFFEGQDITPRAQRDLAARFGALHIHPIYPTVPGVPEIIVLDTDETNLPDNDAWHTDVTFIETPPAAAVLAAKSLPPAGGDTLWSSGVAAYEALSEPFRAFLSTLRAEHDFTKAFPQSRWGQGENAAQWLAARDKHPPVTHPVIRTHPVTGRKALFVNEQFTRRIIGLTARESDALLQYLFTHVGRPEFVVRWRWKLGDIALWDNRVTQHYAIADYLPNRRIMHRATVLGDRPV